LKIASIIAGSAVVAIWGGPRQLPVSAAAEQRAPVPPKPPVTWIVSPHQDDRPPGSEIDTIVIHDTETPGIREARTIANWFTNPRSGVSAHFIIGKAGEIVQCVPEIRRAFHAGPSLFRGRQKVNDFSLGIELVNAQTGTDPFTEAQYDSLGRLVNYLMARYDVPSDRIVGHHDVTLRPSVKRDPAPNFDWERFISALEVVPGTEGEKTVENRGAMRRSAM
jgi:N-acetylmuramoyl-L-alanine amidase